MTPRKQASRFGIKRALFAAFAGFTTLTLIVLWTCQILLLDKFYYFIIRNRMEKAADEIMAAFGTETFAESAVTVAEREEACMMLYAVSDTSAYLLAEYEARPGCLLHALDGTTINNLYGEALENGGRLQYRPERQAHAEPPDGRMVFVRLSSDASVMLMTDCAVAPVTPIISALRTQLLIISAGLVILAAALAFILARRISAPIERINEKAKKLAEEQHGDFHENAYREIAELSDTLNRASADLAQVERLQKELIANISHDLRTPLTMITGYAEMMRDIPGEQTPENMQVIIDEAKRLSSLVNDLLEISKIQAGGVQMNEEKFDLSATVEQTVERYRRLKESDGYGFRYETDGEAFVSADRERILQVLCNLLNNAVNYSEEEKIITVRCLRRAAMVRVEVCDRGRGIPQEELENIWQRYYKADKTHTRSVIGSGLGLSIVREILDKHRAHYGVYSKIGEGSTFWFELPICERSE